MYDLATDEEQAGTLQSARRARIAFQPIVSMSSLRTHGFEALARLPGDIDASSVHDMMDRAALEGELRSAERILLAKAVTGFARFEGASAVRLFCNVDNRIFDDTNSRPANVIELARRAGLAPGNLCIELSERQPPRSPEALKRLVDIFLVHNVRIAIDDFGRGFSGLTTLMQVNPHYVKIDRAFIEGVSTSPRRQAIVNKVAGLAHSLGFVVVAEGVENEADFRTARDLGCDLAQGFLIARPTTSTADLSLDYSGMVRTAGAAAAIDPTLSEMIADVEPIRLADPLVKAIDMFKSGAVTGLLPVVDDHGQVHGAIYESDIRYYLFGDYGAALLANRGIHHGVESLLRRCPISEATVSLEAIVESYVVAKGNQGLIVTQDGRYLGVLGNHEVLRLAAARDVATARDQNPLTFLPGNNSINRHMEELLAGGADRTLVFFDFDNFKAFNDSYGFALGDRALLMFADLLLKYRYSHDLFVGNIGGDDFFMSIPEGLDEGRILVASLCARFRQDVESLYAPEDREKGGIWANDRFGKRRFFPILRASAALLPLPASRSHLSQAAVVASLSDGKKQAKKAPSGIASVLLPETAVAEQISRLEKF